MSRKETAIKWLWERLDPLLALLISSILAILAITGDVGDSTLQASLLGVLTIFALSLLRDRDAREHIRNHLERLNPITALEPDAFFGSSTSERPILEHATVEILLVQETCRKILEDCKQPIIELLKEGCIVRIVVTSPDPVTTSLIAFRNDNVSRNGIARRYHETQEHLRDISVKAPTNHLQVRFTPYPISSTMTLADPQEQSPSSRAIIRKAGFMEPYDSKLDFSLTGQLSPRTMRHYYEEGMRTFHHASKIVLLSGEPRSGKTTLMRALVDEIEDTTSVFHVLSLATWGGDIRTGFEVHSNEWSTPKSFAKKTGDGDYTIQSGVWNDVGRSLSNANDHGKVLLIDEIGRLQLEDGDFERSICAILEDPTSMMIATVGANNHHPFLRILRRHYRVTVVELVAGRNSAEVRVLLKREIESAIRTAAVIRHLKETAIHG